MLARFSEVLSPPSHFMRPCFYFLYLKTLLIMTKQILRGERFPKHFYALKFCAQIINKWSDSTVYYNAT